MMAMVQLKDMQYRCPQLPVSQIYLEPELFAMPLVPRNLCANCDCGTCLSDENFISTSHRWINYEGIYHFIPCISSDDTYLGLIS